MTVTLTFKSEVEAGLLAQARTTGMSVEEYLLSIVEGKTSRPASDNARSHPVLGHTVA